MSPRQQERACAELLRDLASDDAARIVIDRLADDQAIAGKIMAYLIARRRDDLIEGLGL